MPGQTDMVLFTKSPTNEFRVWVRVTMPAYVKGDAGGIAVWFATWNTLQAMQRQLPAALEGTPLEHSATFLLPSSYYDQMVNA